MRSSEPVGGLMEMRSNKRPGGVSRSSRRYPAEVPRPMRCKSASVRRRLACRLIGAVAWLAVSSLVTAQPPTSQGAKAEPPRTPERPLLTGAPAERVEGLVARIAKLRRKGFQGDDTAAQDAASCLSDRRSSDSRSRSDGETTLATGPPNGPGIRTSSISARRSHSE